MAGVDGKLEPHHIKWKVLENVKRSLRAVRKEFGEDGYAAEVTSLKKVLCAYFDGDCTGKSANISPLGGVDGGGGKAFKVRWGTPGSGKSGGLRMLVVAFCKAKRVEVRVALMRKDADGVDFLAGATDDEPGA